MGNADAQEMYYNRTFWEAALGVLPIAGSQTFAFAVALLFILGLTRAFGLKLSLMRLLIAAIFVSFPIWPVFYFAYLHVEQPPLYADWLPALMQSPIGLIVAVIFINLPASLSALLCVPVWFMADWLSSFGFKLGYFFVFWILPLAWLFDCYPGAPR